MKKKNLLLFSALAIMSLASCGGENKQSSSKLPSSFEGVPSSDGAASSLPIDSTGSTLPTPSSSSVGGGNQFVTTKEALRRALAADYSNMTVYSGALANEFETGEYELYYNDYQIVYSADSSDDYKQYYHDYKGESHQFFKAGKDGVTDAWLKKGYNDAAVGLGNFNSLDIREVISAIDKYQNKVQYQQGVFYIVDPTAVEEIVRESYMWAYDVSINTIYFLIDATTLTFSKIGGFDVDIDTDKNQVAAELYQIGTTTWSQTLPPAPNDENVKEYWQYKGWSGPQVQVYPASLSISVDEGAKKDGEAYVLEIEEGVPFDISATWDVASDIEEARQVRHNSITYVSTDEEVAYVAYNNAYTRLIVGGKAGDAEIYAVAEAPDGATPVESNHIKVHVNPLADQNLEGAVYNLTFDGTIIDGNVASTNRINNTKPFDVTVNEGVNVLTGTEASPIFNGINALILRSGQQETMNKDNPGDAIAAFDFSDQEVSGVSFYYGALYSNYYVGENYVSKIAIETSNDGSTWTEVSDITDEIKSHNSPDNLHLLERSFAPASKVRIHMYSNMIGVAYEMSIKSIAFIADENCHEHFEAPNNPVTAVNIAAANGVSKVKIGNTLQINGSVTPNNASNKTLVWHVDDPSKASISNSGLLTPLTPGTVKVYATSAYGATSEPVKSNEITITIAPQDAVNSALIGTWKEEGYPANYFEVSANEAKLKFGDGKEITLPYAMNDDDGYAVFGTFSEKNVAGYFKIKISSSFANQADYSYNIDIDNKNYKANVYSQNESLTKYIKASSMALSVSKSTIKVGDSAYISAIFGPSGASEEAYKLEVSDTSIIAFIDEEGDEVAKTDMEDGKKSFRAKGDGTVTITATSESGLTATIDVTIAALVKVTSISVSLGNDQIAVGGTTKASVTITPSNADNTAVTWSSSDPSVATVSSNGTVTGKKAGFCEIIATAKDGSGITGSARVTVSSEAPSVSWPSELVGQSFEALDPCYQSFTFVYTFASETEFTIYSEDGDVDATFVLRTRDGNTYQLVDANDPNTTCTIVIDDSGSIFLTVDNSNPWGSMNYQIDGADITNPDGI